ncbi:MAG: B12-binding domain-containing radical SAM protein [Acetobacteraceae bacterium]|nr:B12-binding domain-containing radical SAM protein [Acetobacteraceae bacterium]
MPCKVSLVNPMCLVERHSYVASPHMGLAYVGGALRAAGHQVQIADADALRLSEDQLVDRVLAYNPDAVGITFSHETALVAMDVARRLKAASPAHIVVGGHHATFTPDEILHDYPAVDSVVRGDGEETASELCWSLDAREPLEGIRGLSFRRRDGRIVHNDARPALEDLSRLPWPARDVVREAATAGFMPIFPIVSSRGCPGVCSFCSTPNFYRQGSPSPRRWRGRQAADVVNEMECLYREYDARHIYFCDDNFIGPPQSGWERAREIAELLKQRNLDLTFEIDLRADALREQDLPTLGLLKEAGLIAAYVGLESGSASMLRVYTKGTSPAQNVGVMRTLAECGIFTPKAGCIMFNPYATFDDLYQNVAMLDRVGQVSFWNLTRRLELFPGTSIAKRLQRDGLLLPRRHFADVFNYRFIDERIAAMADELDFYSDPRVQRIDSLANFIDVNLPMMLARGRGHKLPMALPEGLKALRAEVSRLHLEFFLRVAECAQRSRAWEARPYREPYLETLVGLFEQTQEATVAVLEEAHASLAAETATP